MRIAALALLFAIACTDAPAPRTMPAADILIRNGRIVDGTGNPWYRGDVAIDDGVIVAIGPRVTMRAAVEIDATDLVVAPGFIDLHTHARRGIFEKPSAENYVRQGVTTLFEGPDGSSPLPIGAFLTKLESAGPAVNIGTFVGHGSIREEVLGLVNRQPNEAEMQRMRDLARQAMLDGAFGLSSGLFYVPGTFARTEEVIELGRVVGELGGHHTSHMRDEAAGVVESVRETIRIGEEGRLPTHVTHHKVVGTANLGLSTETLRAVDEARRRGVDVTIDQYPYTASATSLQSILPSWALEGGREELLKRIADPATRPRLESEVVVNIRTKRGGSLRNIQLAGYEAEPALAGSTIEEIAALRGIEPTMENGARLILDLLQKGPAGAIYHSINEADLERILVHPMTAIASDGGIPTGRDWPHPRSYGTFTRVLGHYVRERKLLSLEEAIRKMTSFPAQRAGLTNRGVLREGMLADVTVFDPARITDRATYRNPHQHSEGVVHVIVNGEAVLRDGKLTGAMPGRVLRGPAARGTAPRAARPGSSR